MLKRRVGAKPAGERELRAPGGGAPPLQDLVLSSRLDRSFSGAAQGDKPREAELVFLADAADFKSLGASAALGGPAKLRWGAQHSVGYDTDAAELHRSGITLQMRRARARNVMCLTTLQGPVEVTAPGDAPEIALLPPAARGLVAKVTEQRSLRPWFSWQIRRATRLVSFEGAMIEVAFEEGEIVAETKGTPIREIGLKLKGGEPAALYRLGLALTKVSPLRLCVVSKFERGLALALDAPGASTRPPAPPFDAEASLDAAIGGLLRQVLAHFLDNWAALISADPDEGVHQVRVALRRLRSLLAVLRRAFPASEVDRLRAEAKRIADAFGDARDWRVFSDSVADGLGRRLPNDPGLSALIGLAGGRAAAGRAMGLKALEARATTRFVLALQLYICTHGWRNAASELELRALGEPAVGFAARALERGFRGLKKRARGFEELAPEGRHEMRIALKQLRYAVDFFGVLFKPAADVESFVDKAADLQDMLGAANDAAVAGRLIASLDLEGDVPLAFAAGAVVGWRQRGGALEEKSLRREWRAFRKARPFWRDELEDREQGPGE